jgi:peptidoglycan/xylan/chitin deacetylase (PgdA/CDA1 family)
MTAVLMYHDVRPEPVEGFERYTVKPDVLRAQIEAFLEAGYVPARLDAHDGSHDGSPTFCVTFDDGFATLAQHAVPVLDDLDVPATIFVPTAWVGSTAAWLDGRAARMQLLDWSELRDVERLNLEIGGHGRSHQPLDVLEPDAVARELTESGQELAERLGGARRAMAYPFGAHSGAARAMANAAGFRSAYAVGEVPIVPTSDRWALPRITARAEHDGDDLVRLARRRAQGRDRAVWVIRGRVYRGLRRAFRVGPRAHQVDLNPAT